MALYNCSQIAMAKQKMVQLNNIWKDRGIPLFLELKILKCLIWPVVLYGCEAWTLRKEESDKSSRDVVLQKAVKR